MAYGKPILQYKQGFLDTIALERTLDDIVSQRIYEEWKDWERLFEWRKP